MFGKKKKRRFSAIYPDGKSSSCKIILDKETGVNYLFVNDGVCAGLTVMVDKDGKPIVTLSEDKAENSVVTIDDPIDVKPIVTSVETKETEFNEPTAISLETNNEEIISVSSKIDEPLVTSSSEDKEPAIQVEKENDKNSPKTT